MWKAAAGLATIPLSASSLFQVGYAERVLAGLGISILALETLT